MSTTSSTTTRLYESIQRCDWNSALRSLRLHPEEASSWVTLHHSPNDDNDDDLPLHAATATTQRFLPLHSAMARNPPPHFLRALIDAHGVAVREKDGTGMLPLHYACGNRCPLDVLEMLLHDDDGAAAGGVWERDTNGMTPLHYVTSWGPAEPGVLEALLRAAEVSRGDGGRVGRTVADWILQKDVRGMDALTLAREADYVGKHKVVALLEQYLKDDPRGEDDRLGLQVVAASPSPTTTRRQSRYESTTHPRPSPLHGKKASPWFTRHDVETISTAHADKDKRVPPLPSPRSTRSDGSRDYPIHMMDDRRSPSEDSRSGNAAVRRSNAPRDDNDNDDGNTPSRTRRQRYSITVSHSPLQQQPPHSSASTCTPHPPPSAIRTESPNTPTIMNMKTPRSSGRGGTARFQFDPTPSSPAPLPVTRNLFSSPRGQPSLSPRRASCQQQQQLEVASELLQRLQLENETLRRESLQKEAECEALCARLSRYERGVAATTDNVVADHHRLREVLRSLAERERALTEIVHGLQRRERRRVDRTRDLWKWLQEEEEEEEGGGSWESRLGKERQCLKEVRDEVGRMLEGLGE